MAQDRFVLASIPGEPTLALKPEMLGAEDIVFISGSRCAGFGNPRSDVDVFVVTSNAGRPRLPRTQACESYYIDYEIYARGELVRVAAELNNLDLECLDAVVAAREEDLNLYYRTAIGQAIWHESLFNELRVQFREDRVGEVYEAWAGLRAGQMSTLAELASEADLERIAMQYALAGAQWATEALACRYGEAYVGIKWIFEKLKRHLDSSNVDYRAASRILIQEVHPNRAYVTEADRYCGQILGTDYKDRAARFVVPTLSRTTERVATRRMSHLVIRRMFVIPVTRESEAVLRAMSVGERSLESVIQLAACDLGDSDGTSRIRAISAFWGLVCVGAVLPS